MKKIQKQIALEQLFYLAIWLLIWCAPVVNFLAGNHSSVSGEEFWEEVRGSWIISLPFFVLFLLNNYLMLPLLFLKKKYAGYILGVILCITVIFHIVPQCVKTVTTARHASIENTFPPARPEFLPEHINPSDARPGFDGAPAVRPGAQMGRPPFIRPLAPSMVSFINIIVAVLFVGFNLTVKLFVKSIHNEEVMKDLQHQRLESELQYLKYQLNPHFFMNTLNNIHALVDIDQEKAKSIIIELSKLMRYVLYESNSEVAKLDKEIQFLSNYISLMRLRYNDKLDLMAEFPVIVPDVSVPPLLFISLIENAFKHGVSYKMPSYIHVQMKVEDEQIIFNCRNSKHIKNGSEHGVGLDNVRKRLKLLFGNNYTYTVDESDEYYHVLLIIPFLS